MKNITGLKKLTAWTVGGLAFAGVTLVIILAAWPQSSADAKADFCDSLSNLSATVMSYQGLNPATATNEELDAAYDDIAGAYDQVVEDADDWANAYDNPLAEAYDDLYWAAQDLPSDYTVAEDLASLEDELAAFPGAFHETFDGSGCSTTSS
jgi:hypothetical protein